MIFRSSNKPIFIAVVPISIPQNIPLAPLSLLIHFYFSILKKDPRKKTIAHLPLNSWQTFRMSVIPAKKSEWLTRGLANIQLAAINYCTTDALPLVYHSDPLSPLSSSDFLMSTNCCKVFQSEIFWSEMFLSMWNILVESRPIITIFWDQII